MNWRLALVAFAVLPLIVLVAQWFRSNVRDSYRVVRGWIARINAFLQENITGMATVQLFRREALNFARFDEIDRKHRDANIESIFYYAVFYPAIEVVARSPRRSSSGTAARSVLRQTLTLGALVAFLQYSQRFFRPISDMSEKFNVLQAAMASSERIFELLDEPVAIELAGAARRAARRRPRGHIVFDHVWFAYNEASDCVLRDVPLRGAARASASASSGRRERARRRSSTCCCGSTTSTAAASPSTASTSASSTWPTCAGCSASSCRTCTCSRARSPTTSASATRRSTTSAVRRAAQAVHADAFIERLPGGYASAGGRAGRDAVGRAEAAAVVRARAGVRSRAC